MSYEGQGEGEDHRLGGAEIDKVVIAEGGVVAVGVVVPHVGGEVGVDVGVAEVCKGQCRQGRAVSTMTAGCNFYLSHNTILEFYH